MTTIHPSALVDSGAQIADSVEIGPLCVVGPNVILHAGVHLGPHVVVDGHTEVGADTTVQSFSSLGGPPQHLGHRGEPTKLIIGERNSIREHVTMNTGTVAGGGVTRVGDDGLYMVGAHVAHDCIVGDKVVFANNATLAGHVQVGDFVFMGGLCAVHQFTRIGRYSFIGGGGIVTKDIIPYGSVWGNHAHLEGLNLVGLKRRGFTRQAINDLRAAWRLLFAPEGTFQERLEDVARVFSASPEVSEIVEFIRVDANRPLCLPSL